jgi:hypothetical protein
MALMWDFPESNIVLMPPADAEPGSCLPLPAHRSPDGRFLSCWKLTDEELAEVQRTGMIWLAAWGVPPVYVTALKDEVLQPA